MKIETQTSYHKDSDQKYSESVFIDGIIKSETMWFDNGLKDFECVYADRSLRNKLEKSYHYIGSVDCIESLRSASVFSEEYDIHGVCVFFKYIEHGNKK